jgi:hypothetical protein
MVVVVVVVMVVVMTNQMLGQCRASPHKPCRTHQ